MADNWKPKIGITKEERKHAELYARRFGWVDAVVRIKRGMRHRTRQLYIIGYDSNQIKYRVRYDQAIKMVKPRVYNVAIEDKLKYFLMKAKEIHGDKYDYSKVEFEDIIRLRVKIPIICPKEGHGVFMQEKENHIHHKQGCPSCAKDRRKKIWITSSKK